MSKVSQHLNQLWKRIKIPYKVIYVDRVIPEDEWDEHEIYIHFWLKGKDDGTR